MGRIESNHFRMVLAVLLRACVFFFHERTIQSYLFYNVGAPKRAVVIEFRASKSLCSFTTNSAGKLDVFGHDGDSLGVYSAQVGVFKQANKVRFGSFLQS